ncbi:hypothetical protein A2U01_0071450, partial [Trifolium medium]|nr:hypothetical protein [Trifolium medium]
GGAGRRSRPVNAEPPAPAQRSTAAGPNFSVTGDS